MKLRTILLGTALGIAMAPMPAEAGFVAAAVSAVAGWVGSTVAAGGIAGALLQTGLGMAASRLVNAVFGRKQPDREPGGIKTQVEQTGGTNPQSFILGKYATQGTRVCPPMSHGQDNRYLTYVISLSDIPIERITAVYIDGGLTDFDDDDDVLLDAQGDLRGSAWMRFHDGRQTAADSWLMDTYGDYPKRPWRSDMVLTGVAYAVMVYKFNQEEYSGWPKARFQVNGIDLYDPRKDSSVGGSGSQRWNDPSTWWFTTNPEVMKYNIFRGITLPDGSMWGLGAEAEDLPLDNWFAAMNACEEQVDDGEGGTENRYRAGLEVSVDQEPWGVIEDLNAADGGDVVEIGGRFYSAVGAPDAPTYYLTDEDLVITEGRDFSPFPGLTQAFNGVSATYPDPRSNWESTEARPYYNAAWEAEDQGRRLVASLDLAAVPYPRQVRALMRELAKDNRRERTHVITLPPDALGVRPLQTISWTSEFNGYVDKLFEVTAAVLDPETLCKTVTIRERDPEDYDPDAAFDAVQPTPPDRDLVVPTYEGIPAWQAYAVVIRDKLDRPRRVGIALEWDPEVPAEAIAWRIKVAENGDLVDEGSMSDVRRGGTVRIADGIIPAETFTVEGRMVGAKNSMWTTPILVTTDDVGLIESDFAQALRDKINAAATGSQEGLEKAEAIIGAIEGTITDEVANEQGVANVELFAGKVNNFAATFAGITAETVGGNIAGFRAVSWDDPDGTESGGGASLQLLGDVYAPSSISTSKMTVTDLNNLIPDGNLAGGTLAPWVVTGGDFGVRERGSGGSSAVASAPTKWVFESTEGADAYCPNFLTDDQRLQVNPGDRLKLKLSYAGGGSNINREVFLQARFVNADGGYIDWRGLSRTATSTSWTDASDEITVPNNAAYIDAWRVVALDGAGSAYLTKPYAYRMNAAELVVDGGITATKADVGSFSAAGLSIFGGDLRSNNYNGSNGWIIRNNGSAEFKNLVARDWIRIGAVGTDEIGDGAVSASASRNSLGSIILSPRNGSNTYYLIFFGGVMRGGFDGFIRVEHNGDVVKEYGFDSLGHSTPFFEVREVSAKSGNNTFQLFGDDLTYPSLTVLQMEK